jgi:type IV fimbrial biogenesis protein FimT
MTAHPVVWRRAGRASPQPRRPEPGFTIIELMVVVALVAVMLTIAIPSFRNLTQRNRVSGEINLMIGDLEFARAEALQRGVPVSICPSSNGTACLGTNTWQSGWIVFSDLNGSGAVDNASDVVLRIRAPWTSGDTFVASPSVTSIVFGGQGMALNFTATTMPIHTTPANARATQCLYLNLVGHQTVQSVGTGSCA